MRALWRRRLPDDAPALAWAVGADIGEIIADGSEPVSQGRSGVGTDFGFDRCGTVQVGSESGRYRQTEWIGCGGMLLRYVPFDVVDDGDQVVAGGVGEVGREAQAFGVWKLGDDRRRFLECVDGFDAAPGARGDVVHPGGDDVVDDEVA